MTILAAKRQIGRGIAAENLNGAERSADVAAEVESLEPQPPGEPGAVGQVVELASWPPMDTAGTMGTLASTAVLISLAAAAEVDQCSPRKSAGRVIVAGNDHHPRTTP